MAASEQPAGVGARSSAPHRDRQNPARPELMQTTRLPAAYALREHVVAGAGCSATELTSQRTGTTRRGTWTDFEGAKPADLPVEQATKFETVGDQAACGRAAGRCRRPNCQEAVLQLYHPNPRRYFVRSKRYPKGTAGAQKTSDIDVGQRVNPPWTPCLFGSPDLRALRAHWKMFPLNSS